MFRVKNQNFHLKDYLQSMNTINEQEMAIKLFVLGLQNTLVITIVRELHDIVNTHDFQIQEHLVEFVKVKYVFII